ncbi:NAD(P)/FAD-dependent oxidoreductase [Streptomyces sp. NPDC059455]|uniref:NAD(P)/FAD-dependent oxidoreductase n=1 Tax=Streptomyces sp. NPDC059455 TaxID=3346837 RepID=UPI00367FA324
MNIDQPYDIVVVGCGHGGAQVAVALRQNGFTGSVALVGDDHSLPYERPPLSKEYLLGTKHLDELLIRPPEFWTERGVDFVLGRAVEAVDSVGHRVVLTDGTSLGYRRLVWAAGGTARKWNGPGAGLKGLHSVRNAADIDRITDALDGVSRVCIIGGGYIGLETAAVMRQLGKDVTLLEAADRVLARVAGETVSRFFEAEHRRRGVDVRTGAVVSGFKERDGRVCAVELGDGTEIPCGLVVVGIGIDPVVAPLQGAGASTDNGVVVDTHCMTSLPDVYAVGDCAVRANTYAHGRPVRLESVHNATDQANIVARHICGLPHMDETLPWFWSHQYDIRLQTVGLSAGHDLAVTRGDIVAGRFSVVYVREGSVIALDCVNSTKEFVQGRSLVMQDVSTCLDQLGDISVPLKKMAQGRSPATNTLQTPT